MKTFEERHTAWLDGRLGETESAKFEGELAAEHGLDPVAERATLGRLKLALRAHLADVRMPNPDFFNHRLMERIHADGTPVSSGRRPWLSSMVSRLFLVGATALVLGVVSYRGLIAPRLEEPRPETAYLTQVLDAKSPAPEVSAVSFNANANDKPAAVLWLDGMEHVPESYAVADEISDPDAAH